MKKRILLGLMMILLFAGCSTKEVSPKDGSNTIIRSTDLINNENLKKNFVLIQRNAKDEMTNRFFAYIPITLEASSLESAVESLTKDMMNKYGADLLTNVSIETDWLVTVYYNTYTYYITADVWKRKI
jgi:PBP1b-binding outer membrane lipoprotein LpoB